MTELEHDILTWFANAPVGPWIGSIPWVFPALEGIHFIAVCALFGSLLLVDLRLLGVLRGAAPAQTFGFLWITMVSFGILLLSGLGFFFTSPFNYWGNWAFVTKMALVVLAGVNAAVFTLLEHRKLSVAGASYETNVFTRISALSSLVLWIAVLTLGRSLPLFDSGQG